MATLRENLSLSYDDVLLYPQMGFVETRKDVELSTRLTKNHWINLPIVSAPMSSVTESDMAMAMWREGGFGFIHRFMSVEEQILNLQRTADPFDDMTYERVGLTIGANEGYERLERLFTAGGKIFCLDTAHAHSSKVRQFIKKIDVGLRGNIQLVVGNVATGEGARFLVDLGVDAVKVGIGPGAACSTRQVTGFGVPQLSAIMAVYEAIEETVPIIADGGIKNSGDVAKALAAGASTVMLGRLLAGADEAPHPGEYFGMASKRVNGHNAPEGVEGNVEATGPVADTLKQLEWGLKSAISYGGGTNLDEFRRYAEFVRVSPAVAAESGVRI